MKVSEASSTATKKPASTAAAPAACPSPRSAERFRLDGPSIALDPRINAYRRDIADIALADRLFAPHYAQADTFACAAPWAMMRDAPSHEAAAVSQLLHGESFAVLDVSGGWAWGYALSDRYVGYVPAGMLGDPVHATHVVTAPTALVFARPDIKSPLVACWPVGARLAGEEQDGFVATAVGHVHMQHVARADARADPVLTAERMIGLPYLWGGRGGGGIDCSGLVQLVLGLAGIAVPRDSDQQRGAVGEELAADAPLARGDILFFPGHVGMMADGTHLIHANAYRMAVTVDPLAEVIARVGAEHANPVLARRRLRP